MSGVWLRDIADILREAGLPVIEETYNRGPYKGRSWKTVGYGHRGLTEFRGVMWHHDASPPGDSPGALDWCMYMPIAPAAAAWVDRYGVWYLYAAGLSNHAGRGSSALAPNNTGNQYYFGIETDHTDNEPWPAVQLDSLRRGTAAIMEAYSLNPRVALEFHKSYAPGRKPDPDGLELGPERDGLVRLISDFRREEKKLKKLQRLRRGWRRRRNKIRATGKTAGLSSARAKIRSLNQRIKSITG